VYTWRGLEEKRRRKGSHTLERRGYYGGDRGLIDDSALGFNEERCALLCQLHKAEDVDLKEFLGDSNVRVKEWLRVSYAGKVQALA
jgi:hypothetical protein